MLRKLILALSFSSLAAFSGSVLAAAFDITDIEGRKVHFEDQPKTFIVANYIANFMMVGGAASLEKVVALTKDGWEDTRYGEYQVFTKSFPKMKDLPSIGGYHDDILNAEKILSLHPDVLLIGRTQYAENSQRIKAFEKAGIKVVVLDYHAMTTVNHTLSTEILGKLLTTFTQRLSNFLMIRLVRRFTWRPPARGWLATVIHTIRTYFGAQSSKTSKQRISPRILLSLTWPSIKSM